MATLEEIAQQFEDALTESTGTTIEPGTITPQGIRSSVSGKKKLSWPEIVEKINEGVAVRQDELLPDVPKGVSAQKFYRTATKSGLMPSGLNTFTSSPFGSFSKRMSLAQQASTESAAPAPAVESVTAPKSVIQTQREAVDEGGISPSDEATNYAEPIANPDFTLASIPGLLMSPISTGMKLASSENVYTTLDGYTPDQIDDMISRGILNDDQIAAFQQGITNMTNAGEPVDYRTGKAISLEEYDRIAAERDNNNILFTGINKLLTTAGFEAMEPGARKGFEEGYQEDGTYIDSAGRVSGGSTWAAFESLIETNLDRALEIIDEENRGVGGLFGVHPTLAAQARAADARRGYSRRVTSPSVRTSAPLILDTRKVADRGGGGGIDIGGPQPGDPDAPGEQDIDGGDDQGSDPGSEDMGTDGWLRDGGAVKMQDGGMAPQGAEADMSNLGMINEQAAQPQQGGAMSVKDDIPREADAGDYILPYETVLLVGLKDLNRYAKEAIDLAMENGVNLKGTDLDPSDDVPIKVSNYEYHIPKMLVPFFGGGKKYLDKIRKEGLDLRTRLEEEKQPSMQEQQPMAKAVPAPSPKQEVAAPQAPMMQQGGFVDDPQKKQMQTSAAVLEADASQQSPSAYNQMQALERTRRQAQQPPMVDPMGRVVQQGFAAPQGYADGDEVKQETMPPWASRALDPKTPVLRDEVTGDIKTVRTMSINYEGKEILFPMIRMKGKKLVELTKDEAVAEALNKKDYISFNTPAEATEWSKNFSQTVNDLRGVQQGFAAPQGYALGTEPGGLPMPEAGDEVYSDIPELPSPLPAGPDPFMQKRTEPMATPEPYSDEGIGGDDKTLGDIIGQPEKPMPTEEMAKAKQAMQTLQNLPDLALMAIVAIGEARNQDREGMQAVMHVMKNRLKYPKRFGKNINEVITKKHQFSALLPDLDDPETYKGPRYENFKTMMKVNYKDEVFQNAVKDADKIMKGELPDITKGSTHYYNFKTIKPPSWAKDMVENVKIKSHIFLGIGGMQNGGFVARAA